MDANQELLDCVCKATGWPPKAVATELAHLYKQLSGAIHDRQRYQQSLTKVDLVVPHPLQPKQAEALLCIAEHLSIEAQVVPQAESDSE